VKSILYRTNISSKALDHGKNYESEAILKYI